MERKEPETRGKAKNRIQFDQTDCICCKNWPYNVLYDIKLIVKLCDKYFSILWIKLISINRFINSLLFSPTGSALID